MSLNKLVGGDCGGNNSLVQLSNIVGRDASISQSLSQADHFVNEFIAQNSQIPQTFNMNTLLNNIPEAENVSNLQQTKMNRVVYSPQMHSTRLPGPSTSFMTAPNMLQNFQAPLPSALRQQHMSNVSIQYMDESELESTQNSDVRAKAQEYVETVNNDDEQAYNQFMSFMKRISAGELNIGDTAQDNERAQNKDKLINEMAEKYKDDWAKLSDVKGDWSLTNNDRIPQVYEFTESNIMLENKSAFELGKEKLKMGDIPGAVLCFEAAVQQQPDSAEAWFYLGTTQAENEQDPMAITALKKSLEIEPRQLEAYITLAAAYTNEDMPRFALIALSNWLNASPKYSDILPRDVDTQALELKDLEDHIKSLYLKAAQLNPTQIDPDIQNALGVIFNISQEYDKAVDCFKTALMVSSDNAKLWNRLGATLANSNRSDEAVDAYHEALNLEPGFIRARYNVGVTCMNLGANRQAAEHFLVALNQQNKDKTMQEDKIDSTSSSTIWSTLRMVCSFLGEHDAAKLVDDRNLSELNKHFEIDA